MVGLRFNQRKDSSSSYITPMAIGNRVCISSTKQQPLIVTLTSSVKQLIQVAHEKLKDNPNDIDALRKYIRHEINSIERHGDIYPSSSDIKSVEKHLDVLPPSLNLLLNTVIKSLDTDLLCASLGQAIMTATCSRRNLLPIQIGLAVIIDHKYGHQDLGDLLNKLGFFFPYSEGGIYNKRIRWIRRQRRKPAISKPPCAQ